MAAATYSTLPASGYAGFDSEGDPYQTNNPGTYDSDFGAIPPQSYQNQTNGYGTNHPHEQQQPMYSNEYQQSPYANDPYNTQQPQNVYEQQPSNPRQQQPHYSNEYQQPPYANDNRMTQQPQHMLLNTYPPQPSMHPNDGYTAQQQLPNDRPQQQQQQQPFYSDEYQQAPYSNDDYYAQQPQTVPSNTYPQQQQPYYTNEYQQSPYSNDGYSTQQQQQPQNIPPQRYVPESVNNQQQEQFNGHANSQIPKTNNRFIPTNNNPDVNTMQPPHTKNMDNHFAEPRNYPQTSYVGHQPSSPADSQHHQSQPYHIQRERQLSNHPPKQDQQLYHDVQSPSSSEHQVSKPRQSLASVHRRSPFNDNDNETISKTNDSRQESVTSKSSVIPNVTKKTTDKHHEGKRKDQTSQSNESKSATPKAKSQNASCQTDDPNDLEKTKQNKKSIPIPSKTKKDSHTDNAQTDTEKNNRNQKQSLAPTKSHKNRRNTYQTEDNYSTDDDEHGTCHRCKTRKIKPLPDKNSRLPPLRQSRKLSHHDPHMDYPSPSRHPSQRRYSHDDLPSNRNGRPQLHRDSRNMPSHRDHYEPHSDYENRNGKSKRPNGKLNHSLDQEDHRQRMFRDDGDTTHRSSMNKNKPPNSNDPIGRKNRYNSDEQIRSKRSSMRYSPDYYNERDTHENWRKEHSKSKLRSNGPDIPFSQPPTRSDSYVENERIRAVRDSQGYYFPYKQYTLKDYNNLKKTFIQNPYSEQSSDSPIDRKELERRRHEYGATVEKRTLESPDVRQAPARELPPVKPWRSGNTGLHDPEEASKRERAIEYAKVQVKKYQALTTTREQSDYEKYGNNPLSKMNDDASHLRVCSICNGLCAKKKQNV